MIVKIVGLALGIGFFFKLFKNKKDAILRTEVLNLDAKLSQFRLALKGKVRKKATVLRSSFKVPIIRDDMIDTSLKQLQEIPFENSNEFQNYFELSKKLVELAQIGVEKNENTDPAAIENTYMSSDFKTEIEIIRLIKEMYLISTKINSKVEEYNKIKGREELHRVDDLKFPSMIEINRVFRDEDVSQNKNVA